MRRMLLLVTVVAVVAALTASPAMAKQTKVTVCHNGHEISIAMPALKAHLAHGDKLEGPCGEDVDEGEEEACQPGQDPLKGAEVTVINKEGGDPDIVEEGDILSISGNFQPPTGFASVTVEDKEGTEATFTDEGENANAEFAFDGDNLLIAVREAPTVELDAATLVGVSSEGITCAEEEEDEEPEPTRTTVQEEGAKSAKTKGGAAALKTNSSAAGDKPKLDSQEKEKKEKEKPLKGKGKQVEVKGDPKGTAKDKKGKAKDLLK